MCFLKRIIKIALVLIVLFFLINTSRAQFSILDQNPASLQWNQINTENFKVIFPFNYEKEALHVANTLQYLYKPVSKTLGKTPRKIPIILQNQNTISNGFVTLAPRRSEFFSTPPQDYKFLGTNDWLELLAVHEFRHVVQFDKGLKGLTKGFYYIFGDNGLSLSANIAVPPWFWEGDAVGIETALTQSGRGRNPSFDMAFRTIILEKGGYNSQKQMLNSFKDFVPNYYVTGYFLTTHVRRNTDAQIWDRVLDRAYNFPFLPFKFAWSMKKESGKNLKWTYQSMIEELDSLWKDQIRNLDTTSVKNLLTRKSKIFTSYEFPQFLEDGSIVALKYGLSHFDQFVVIEDNKEKRLFVPGILNTAGMLSSENGKIVWNEYEFDPRWGMRSYSVIKIYDINKNKLRKISKKSRYSAAALSPDATKIVTIENTQEGKNRVVILDTETGKIVKTFEKQDNSLYIMPRWSEDATKIVAVKSSRQGKNIVFIDWEKGEEEELFDPVQENLGHPVLYKNYILYNSPYNGIDNIYAYDWVEKKKYQITSRKYGAFNPDISPDGKNIIFNDFTVNGMDVVQMEFEPHHWQALEQVEDRTVRYYQALVEQENNSYILDSIPENSYTSNTFSSFNKSFIPHSWGPYITSSNLNLNVGLSAQSLLSTTALDLGYSFDPIRGTGFGFLNLSYQGLYPILDLNAKIGTRRQKIVLTNEEGLPLDSLDDTWNEKSLGFGFRLPFTLTDSKYFESLVLGAKTAYTHITNYDLPVREIDQQADGHLWSVNYHLSYDRLLKISKRDIISRYGQTLALNYTHTPFGGDYHGMQFAVEGNLLFPGILQHQSLQLRGGYQYENVINYSFKSSIAFPRGHEYIPFEHLVLATLQYRFPIWYPDIHLGPILNFQRIWAGVFYDYAYGVNAVLSDGIDIDFHAVGIDLLFDSNQAVLIY